jgi:hypothetical protein
VPFFLRLRSGHAFGYAQDDTILSFRT